MAKSTYEETQEFEVLTLLSKIAEALNTDTLQFKDCCIKFAGGEANDSHSARRH